MSEFVSVKKALVDINYWTPQIGLTYPSFNLNSNFYYLASSSISPLSVYGSWFSFFTDHLTFIFIHIHSVLAFALVCIICSWIWTALNHSRINTAEFLSNQTILEFVGVKRLLRFRERFVLLIFMIL